MMFGLDGMNRQDIAASYGSLEPYEGREVVLVEQAAQLFRDGDQSPFPDRLDSVGATQDEKRSILRKHEWPA